jgi:nicotinamidase-related amidase
VNAKLNLLAILVGGTLVTSAALREGQEAEGVPIRPALLVIDVQNGYMPYMATEDRESALPWINDAIALFRELELPVIRVYHTDPLQGPPVDSEPFAFDRSIVVSEDDPRIVKNYPSSFVKTGLEELLREDGRNCVFLCGLSATGCVLATYFGAQEREITPVMIREALLSPKASHTDVIEEICRSMTLDQLRDLLGG